MRKGSEDHVLFLMDRCGIDRSAAEELARFTASKERVDTTCSACGWGWPSHRLKDSKIGLDFTTKHVVTFCRDDCPRRRFCQPAHNGAQQKWDKEGPDKLAQLTPSKEAEPHDTISCAHCGLACGTCGSRATDFKPCVQCYRVMCSRCKTPSTHACVSQRPWLCDFAAAVAGPEPQLDTCENCGHRWEDGDSPASYNFDRSGKLACGKCRRFCQPAHIGARQKWDKEGPEKLAQLSPSKEAEQLTSSMEAEQLSDGPPPLVSDSSDEELRRKRGSLGPQVSDSSSEPESEGDGDDEELEGMERENEKVDEGLAQLEKQFEAARARRQQAQAPQRQPQPEAAPAPAAEPERERVTDREALRRKLREAIKKKRG